MNASLGCGVPTAVADLHEGETVLDLGRAPARTCSSRRGGSVRPEGDRPGHDRRDAGARAANAAAAGVENVEFVKGYIEEIPLPDGSVDVIVSNCVLNLSGDKPKGPREAVRVLRPGGRFAVSDVIADPDMDDATPRGHGAVDGCIAGALTEDEFRDGLAAAGFADMRSADPPGSRVRGSAIIRARKPAASEIATNGTESASAMFTLNITHVTPETPSAAERRVELFEPAMCCQSGVCGPSLDQKLIDIREDLRWAESAGARSAATTCPPTPTRSSPTRR